MCKGEGPPAFPPDPSCATAWGQRSSALKFWTPGALGGAGPRLSPVGGKAEEKQPEEANTQTNLHTRDVLVTERERAHSVLGPGSGASSGQSSASSHLSRGTASLKPPVTPGAVWALGRSPDTSRRPSRGSGCRFPKCSPLPSGLCHTAWAAAHHFLFLLLFSGSPSSSFTSEVPEASSGFDG